MYEFVRACETIWDRALERNMERERVNGETIYNRETERKYADRGDRGKERETTEGERKKTGRKKEYKRRGEDTRGRKKEYRGRESRGREMIQKERK